MLHDTVSSTLELLTLDSCRTWRNIFAKFKDPTFIRSWVLNYDILHWTAMINWQCICSHSACTVSFKICDLICLFNMKIAYISIIDIRYVICQNCAWPCLQDHTEMCARTKSHWNLTQKLWFSCKRYLNINFWFCGPKKEQPWTELHLLRHFVYRSSGATWVWTISRTPKIQKIAK